MRISSRLIAAVLWCAGTTLVYSDNADSPPKETKPLDSVRVPPRKTERVRLPGPVPKQSAAARKASDDTILRAMKDELARSKQLGLASLDQPYFIEYGVDEVHGFSTSATLGAILSTNSGSMVRLPRVKVRVGDYAFDNTNYVYSEYYAGARYDPSNLPLDDNYLALRRAFWLATDRAYKTALEAIGRKRAALKNVTQQEDMPDLWKAEPVKKTEPFTLLAIDEERWTGRVRSLSDVFSAYPAVLGSSVSFNAVQTRHFYINSEGTEVLTSDPLFYLQARASGQAADGMTVRDAALIESMDLAKLPEEAEIRKLISKVGENIKALAAAPAGESYSGPVLVESAAAPQLIAELLGANLAIPRKPLGEPGRAIPFLASELEGRIGSRVLPEFLDVIDDPSMLEWEGHPLAGAYEVDEEGVPAKALTMVEKGRLNTMLLTRQPVKGFERSNGRARLPGSFGARAAAFSNLVVRNTEPVKNTDLKAKLIEMVKQRSKPYGLIVRKMDYPSTAGGSELRRIVAGMAQGGGSRPVSMPILVYRVYPDGREELVRGLRFRGLSVRTLRDIVAAGDRPEVFHSLYNQAPFSLMGAARYVAPVSIVAPPLLFEDLELESPREDLPKLPVVPPPPLGSRG